MCGRFVLTAPGRMVAEEFMLDHEPDMQERYNIAPTQYVAAVRIPTKEAGRELAFLRWGLIPFWAKDEKIGYRTINARSETVESKPAFRAAFKYRRCLIPATGFFEWKRVNGKKKQPLFIRMKGEALFALAGLWESWENPEGLVIESCAILTTDANELLQEIHDRMPVILPKEAYEQWLDPALQKADKLKPILEPYSSEAMETYPVSEYVNKPQNTGPECIEPA